MKGKLIVILLALYGAIIAVAYHFHNMQVHESGLFLFNYIVEIEIIPPILLHYANDVGNPITGNELLALRVIISVIFWGGISGMVYAVWWSVKTLLPVKTEKIN